MAQSKFRKGLSLNNPHAWGRYPVSLEPPIQATLTHAPPDKHIHHIQIQPPKQLKEKKGEWMMVHFVKLATQQETTVWEKEDQVGLCSKVLGVMCSRGCWGKTWAQEINLKLTSKSTINCSYTCGKVVTNEPELGGGLVNCSDCMNCVPRDLYQWKAIEE